MSVNIPTWKSVKAPNYNSANWLMSKASESQAEAVANLQDVFANQAQLGRDTMTGEALAQLSQMNDINTFDQDKANLLANVNMGNLNQEQFMNAAMSRRDTLDRRDQSDWDRSKREELYGLETQALRARIGASNRSGRGGGGGGGSAGSKKDVIYGWIENNAVRNEDGSINGPATNQKFLDMPDAPPEVRNNYYLSNLIKNQREVYTDREDRRAVKKSVATADAKKDHGEGVLKGFIVPTGKDAPGVTLFNLLGRKTNATLFNKRQREMQKAGASRQTMEEFNAASYDAFTDELDATDWDANRIYQRQMNQQNIDNQGKIPDNDPVLKRVKKAL